jgi:osmotically-inducible protein OsmY
VVILSGTVKTDAVEQEAFEAVLHKPGVRYITNNITLAVEE